MIGFHTRAFLFPLCFGLHSLVRFERHRPVLRDGAGTSGLGAVVRRALGDDRRGVTAVEYAVVIGAVALAIAAGFATLSVKLMATVEVLPI